MAIFVVSNVECMNCGKIYKTHKSTFFAQVGRTTQYRKGKTTYSGLGIVGICLCDFCSKLYPIINLYKILWKLGYNIVRR